jgi:hypothetical protein
MLENRSASPRPPETRRAGDWFPMRALTHALFLAFLVIVAVYAFVFLRLGAGGYYAAPLASRG